MHRSSRGDVERFHAASHRNRDPRVAERDRFVGQARSFAAEQQADLAAPVDGVWLLAAARHRRHHAYRRLAHRRHRLMRGHAADNGQAEDAAHAAAKRLPRERVGRRAADERAGDAAGFRRTQQRADVARLLDVHRGQDERIGSRADLGRRHSLPAGDRHDARGALHRADRVEDGIGRLDDIDALALEPLREQSFFRLRGQLRRGHGNRFELQSGRACVAHQVSAVQQQARAGRVGFVRQRSEHGDDGILPARDDLHVVSGWWLVVRSGYVVRGWFTANH